jgi:hypothetical protein
VLNPHEHSPNSEEIIASHPHFSQINHINSVYEYDIQNNTSLKLGKWILLYGRFKVKNSTISFANAQEKKSLDIDMPLVNVALPKKGIGYCIAKFDTLNNELIPTDIAVQNNLPICKKRKDIQENYGELVGLKVKRVSVKFPNSHRIPFYKAMGINFYSYHDVLPKNNRKIWIIDRILSIGKPTPFYKLGSSSSVGSFILWNPRWMEVR